MKPRLPTIYILSIAVAFAFCSCKKDFHSSLDLADIEPSAGEGIDISAAFLADPQEIEDLFGSFLPDSGIVPLLVGIRNNDTVPLTIHSMNSLDLRDEFKGFALQIGGKEILPIHPVQVIEISRGMSRPANYRKIGGKDIAAGVVVAPLGIFYAWKGYKEYREFRPLVRASIMPAGHGGTFGPLTLAPGEEVNGYLYFPLLPEEVPYETEEIEADGTDRDKKRDLRRFNGSVVSGAVLQASVSESGAEPLSGCDLILPADSLGISEAVFCRNDREPAGDPAGAAPRRAIFAIIDRSGDKALHFIPAGTDSYPETPAIFEIRKLLGSSGEIADAEQLGDHYACAVNFKRRSKVFILRGAVRSGGSEIIAVRDYDRKVKRVFLSGSGFSVITDNGVCYLESFSGEGRVYRKLSKGLDDAYILRDGGLISLSGDNVRIYGSGEEPFRVERTISVPEGSRDICGLSGGDIVAVSRGGGGRGDTLISYESASFAEKGRIPFMGKVIMAEMAGERILVQLGEGTVLAIELKEDGEFTIRQSGWASSSFVSATSDSGYFVGIDENGAAFCETIDLMPPRAVSGRTGRLFIAVVGKAYPKKPGLPEKDGR